VFLFITLLSGHGSFLAFTSIPDLHWLSSEFSDGGKHIAKLVDTSHVAFEQKFSKNQVFLCVFPFSSPDAMLLPVDKR
jgi:hypothetical protein